MRSLTTLPTNHFLPAEACHPRQRTRLPGMANCATLVSLASGGSGLRGSGALRYALALPSSSPRAPYLVGGLDARPARDGATGAGGATGAAGAAGGALTDGARRGFFLGGGGAAVRFRLGAAFGFAFAFPTGSGTSSEESSSSSSATAFAFALWVPWDPIGS